MKTCTRCRLAVGLANFPKNPLRKDGHSDWCRKCIAAYGRSYRAANKSRIRISKATSAYGITSAQYRAYLSAQDGKCAICRRSGEEVYRGLHVDHDHVSGRVRGLLCTSCNQGLGRFKDSGVLLLSANRYLQSC